MEPKEHERTGEPLVAVHQRTIRTSMSVRELYDSLPETPGLRVEILGERLIVSPMGTPEHGWIGGLLLSTLLPEALKRGWRAWPGTVGVSIVGTQTPIIPDFIMALKDAPLWAKSEPLSDGLIMVGERVARQRARGSRGQAADLRSRWRAAPSRHRPRMLPTRGDLVQLDVELDTSIFLDAHHPHA